MAVRNSPGQLLKDINRNMGLNIELNFTSTGSTTHTTTGSIDLYWS